MITRRPEWGFVMCGVYVVAIALSFTLPWPLNIIQGVLCGALLPVRLYTTVSDMRRERRSIL